MGTNTGQAVGHGHPRLREPAENGGPALTASRRRPGPSSRLLAGVVDLDPMAVRVLEIDLAGAVLAPVDLAGLAGQIDVGDALLHEGYERCIEGGGGERQMRRELARPLTFRVAADQVQRAEAVDHEPADVAPADAVGDLLKPQHTSIERGTRIDIADKQRSVMQGKRDGHSVTPDIGRPRIFRCRAILEHDPEKWTPVFLAQTQNAFVAEIMLNQKIRARGRSEETPSRLIQFQQKRKPISRSGL